MKHPCRCGRYRKSIVYIGLSPIQASSHPQRTMMWEIIMAPGCRICRKCGMHRLATWVKAMPYSLLQLYFPYRQKVPPHVLLNNSECNSKPSFLCLRHTVQADWPVSAVWAVQSRGTCCKAAFTSHFLPHVTGPFPLDKELLSVLSCSLVSQP